MRIFPNISKHCKYWASAQKITKDRILSTCAVDSSTFRILGSFYNRAMSSVGPVPKEEITKRVLDVLKSFEKIDKTKLSIDARFMPTLGLDSLDHVEVLMALEEEFDLEIPDKIAESILTPKEAVEYIHTELNQNMKDESGDTSHH